MDNKTQELVNAAWSEMVADCKTGSGGIFFEWQKLEATSIDTPSKLMLLSLLMDKFDAVKEQQKTANLSEIVRNIIPEKGQLIFLFEKIKAIPEVNP